MTRKYSHWIKSIQSRKARGTAPVTPKPPMADPEIPAGAKLIKTTVRDALRDAMAEEMRRGRCRFS